MFDHLEFMISESFIALRRNLLMTFAAITTAAVALYLLGGLGYIYFRVNNAASDISRKFEMRVWLKDHIEEARAKSVSPKILAIKGVRKAIFVPRDVEWRRWSVQQPELTKGWEADVLPHSYRVMIDEVADAATVKKQIYKIAEVKKDGVIYGEEEQQFIDRGMSLVRWLGGALGSLMLVTAGILIYNAIRLTIHARRREIRIMQLVGASNATIRTPFLLEGGFQGVVGGIFAAFLISIAQRGVESFTSRLMLGGISIPPFPLAQMLVLLMCVGGAFGVICSTLAIREPLRYKSGSSA